MQKLSILSFTVQDALFGLRIDFVREIIPARTLSSIPRSPAQLSGLLDLRGQAFQIFDLSVPLFSRTYQQTKASCIVLLNFARAGLLVDSVQDVLEVDPLHVEKPPGGVSYLAGVLVSNSGTLCILDPDLLFTDSLLGPLSD